MNKKKKIINYRKRHPHWPVHKIGKYAGCSTQYAARIITAYNQGEVFTDGNSKTSMSVVKYDVSCVIQIGELEFRLMRHDVPRLINSLKRNNSGKQLI